VTKVLENSKQCLKPYKISNIYIPQKLGKVITQLHFLTLVSLLHCGASGVVPPTIKSKGLLTDKETGGYNVTLMTHLNSMNDTVLVYAT